MPPTRLLSFALALPLAAAACGTASGNNPGSDGGTDGSSEGRPGTLVWGTFLGGTAPPATGPGIGPLRGSPASGGTVSTFLSPPNADTGYGAPRLSADGKHLFFLSDVATSPTSRAANSIAVSDLHGANVLVVASCGVTCGQADFTADGSVLYGGAVDPSTNANLVPNVLRAPAGGVPGGGIGTSVLSAPDGCTFSGLAVSPDGTKLALAVGMPPLVTACTTAQTGVFITSTNAPALGTPVAAGLLGADFTFLRFASSGERLFYSGHDSVAGNALYSSALDGSNVTVELPHAFDHSAEAPAGAMPNDDLFVIVDFIGEPPTVTFDFYSLATHSLVTSAPFTDSQSVPFGLAWLP